MHPKRWWNYCMSEDEKNEIEAIFTEKCFYCAESLSGQSDTRRLDIVQQSLPPKFVDSSCKQYIICKYSDILTLKIMHEDLI